MTVSWTASATAASYLLSDNLVLVTLDGGTTQYVWTVTPGSYKCFHVAASNVAGKSAWTAWSCTTSPGVSTAPAQPTSATATGISTSEIRLTWTNNATDATGYRIRRWNNTTWAISADGLAPDATSYVDSGLASATTYEYEVCAYNAGGESCTNSISGTTQ